jgi:hypothetical protein
VTRSAEGTFSVPSTFDSGFAEGVSEFGERVPQHQENHAVIKGCRIELTRR